MIYFAYIVLGVYLIALIYVTIFCMMQFHLLFHYYKHHLGKDTFDQLKPQAVIEDNEWPFVTIQLPIFNEKYVVKRLIQNITSLDYPIDKFEIHVLDDSTDETVSLVREQVDYFANQGFLIEHIRRTDRQGYKAGALRDGMEKAKGEFIAIFDADFLPKSDFLKNTIPYFQNEKIGVVQTRWEHINQDYSLITKLQAFQLNVHFTVEQQGRESADYLLQFNGTAGVWRKETIYDAGGWEADTLTEDLDLSYRAQIKGWKIAFLEEIGSPAELPAEMNSLKTQQYRWMKGGAETAKKILPTVWNAEMKLSKKIHASMHLLSSSVFLFVFLLGVFSVPLLFALTPLDISINKFMWFLVGLFAIIIVYYVANSSVLDSKESKLKFFVKFVLIFPIFLALSMGLSLHNSIAVLQGYRGKKSPFVRTPKFDIKNISDKIKVSSYIPKLAGTTIIEGILALYFLFAVIAGIKINDSSFLIFHILLFVGYSTIFFYSVKHMSFKE